MTVRQTTVSLLSVFVLGSVVPGPGWSQVRSSQKGTLSQMVARTEISLTYNRPVARGREVFGGVVHWGEIWTPGANESTEIEFSDDVSINGSPISAGRYTLWVVPAEEGAWEWRFNSETEVWHTRYPGEDKDVLTVTSEPGHGGHMEVLAFYFPEVGRDSATLALHWGETVVQIAITLGD